MRRRLQPSDDRRAILYARVSSEEQGDSGYSLESDLELMRSYAALRGLELVAEHAVAESAKDAGGETFGKVVDTRSARNAPGHLLI